MAWSQDADSIVRERRGIPGALLIDFREARGVESAAERAAQRDRGNDFVTRREPVVGGTAEVGVVLVASGHADIQLSGHLGVEPYVATLDGASNGTCIDRLNADRGRPRCRSHRRCTREIDCRVLRSVLIVDSTRTVERRERLASQRTAGITNVVSQVRGTPMLIAV